MHSDILRAYDIRGTFQKNLCEDTAITLARVFKTFLLQKHKKNEYTVIIGRDGRLSSPILYSALRETLLKVGVHVIDIGIVSSPMLYFAEKILSPDGAIMITASHNPASDNGFKIMAFGQGIYGEQIQELANLEPAANEKIQGHYKEISVLDSYITHTLKGVEELSSLKNMRVAWDFSNGAVCAAKSLVENLAGTHILLNDILDGTFPAHEPDPTVPENLMQLMRTVKENKCDLGIAFDGDGDRVSVVNAAGEMIAGDRLVTILSQEVLLENPGALILADIKSSRVFAEIVQQKGGIPMLTRTGHSYVKARMIEAGALLAGEMSGHIFYADKNYGYDDGLYAALRLLNYLVKTAKSLEAYDQSLPCYHTSPEIRIPYGNKEKFTLIQKVQDYLNMHTIPFLDADGVRVEDEKGFWLLRASNTQDLLILRFEGIDAEALAAMKNDFIKLMKEIYPDFPFAF